MTLPENIMTGKVLDYDRFGLLWGRCLLDAAKDESALIHQRLVDSYSEPHRFYHTLVHIEECLLLFDKIRPELQNPEAVELAIWFHDAVYQPGAKNNEQLSADQFMALTDNIFDPQLRETVYRHIIATVHNESEVKNADTKYLLDIDLSSFGRPWPEFLRDSDNLRREMKSLTDEVYYQRQTSFQDKLFSQPRFFRNDYFYDNYETQARQNRNRYVAAIRQKIQGD